MESVHGIHHISSIAADARDNLDFYSGTLGLRLVKKTVNFDDPTTYHLYYGDEAGTPGTLLTFFIWDTPDGRPGVGQIGSVALSIPKGSSDYWIKRLDSTSTVLQESERFSQKVISFNDVDGLHLELVEADDSRQPWTKGKVPVNAAIRGVHSITLEEEQLEATQGMLELLGFKPEKTSGSRSRFTTGAKDQTLVDVVCSPDARASESGAGTVHHAAFRTPDRNEQENWRVNLRKYGSNVTPILDRKYFQSIYFREKGGVLFEIATDGPGFTVDEPLDKLGEHLSLPNWLETERKRIEDGLEPLSSK